MLTCPQIDLLIVLLGIVTLLSLCRRRRSEPCLMEAAFVGKLRPDSDSLSWLTSAVGIDEEAGDSCEAEPLQVEVGYTEGNVADSEA
ncbi:unnamed protein product [Protopolystoma xenopodis]|uniref:Uncharacterized protein n=1 Tax=Protopolystoma xenopodis TaxID=117903 RepID=A0A3S5BLG3_9PLAT|nr:unnamed protein product [Protopolystoma xenopodis]